MFHYSKAIITVGPRILAFYSFKIRKWVKHLDKYPREMRRVAFANLMKKIIRALNVDLHIEGLENLPTDQPFYLVCNHDSMFDPVPFLACTPTFLSLLGKKELEDAPFIPKSLQALEGEYIDRNDIRQTLKVMLRVEDTLKKGDRSWMIFPEGTRIRDNLLPVVDFHPGSFRPALKSKTIIVPAAIYGTHRVFKVKPQYKRYPVFVSILKPFTPEEYENLDTGEIANHVRNSIQREITYHLRPLDHKTMSEAKDKAYKFYRL